ncbi:MAG: ubiquinone/menaquinone biosynthesis methyltransferase [Candidatus Zixiibacteriota bacterium]|jgi:demethylmenaquinone methyltransferase/2-methoxy-6-polyprenyl-1,4-benzoquinol methylase
MNRGIQKIFAQVPHTYELINHILTFGMDIICRRKAAKIAAGGGGNRWMDLCSGTGEMAANLARLSQNGTTVYAADFSQPMLSMARKKPEASRIRFVITDVGMLPFPDATFDALTISFATRNINTSRENLIICLKEFNRVLKPGGRFINLETSQPKSKLLQKLMHLYVKAAVKPIGGTISGSKAGYAYLSQTVPRFYPAEAFAEIIRTAGFATVEYRRLFFGIIAIHIGQKKADK